MKFIHTCSKVDGSITNKDIGGKAYSLYVLGRDNKELQIPSWFVVKEGTKDQIENNAEEKESFLNELAESLSSLGKDKLWAVRSSASSEDSIHNSFAGQLDTFLFIPTDKV